MNLDLRQARQQEVRATILKLLDRTRPGGAPLAIINRSLKQSGLDLAKEALQQELEYLAQKAMLRDAMGLYYLLPSGVDVIEGSVPVPPGIPAQAAPSPEVIAYRHEVRWRVLMALNFSRPMGAPSALLWRTLDDSDLPVSDQELAREAGYLRDKGLVEVTGDLAHTWHGKLTAEGIDLVEYAIDAPPGLNRPDKYWEG